MNKEIDNTNKHKTHLGTHRYRMLTLNTVAVTHKALHERFGYHSNYVKPGEPLEVWSDSRDKIEKLIEDIINNSEFELLSVSENGTSLRYHFVSK